MGINIDLGTGDSEDRPKTAYVALAPGKYTADLLKFEAGQNKDRDKYYVQAVFGNVEGGVDLEDNDFGSRKVWSQYFWLTSKAMWVLRKFASGAGVELPKGVVDFEDERELAEQFHAFFTETSDTFEITVEVDENRNKNTDNEVTYTKVAAIS